MAYKEHEAFTPIPDDTVIWRYMDFCKFQSILETGCLWFARADTFKDEYEGSLPEKNREEEERNARLESKFAKPWAFSERTVIKQQPKHVGVSCWHINEVENQKMWTDYISQKDGIAIQSTFGRLKNSITALDDVFIGKVSYINYVTDQIDQTNNFNYLLHKKEEEFKWEEELRAIIFKEPPIVTFPDMNTRPDYTQIPFENGKAISINLNKLIQNIYIKPGCNPEFYTNLKTILKNYGLSGCFNLVPSKLNMEWA